MADHVEVLRELRKLCDKPNSAYGPALDAAIGALSPAGGGGRGCDWHEDEDTGSRIVDFDFAGDHSRQLSLILKADGKVAYAAVIDGIRLNGTDAMTPEFYSAIRMLSASPQKSPAVGDWMMVPARLTGPMAYAMVERLGHPDSSPQDCWTATLAASPQQEPGATAAPQPQDRPYDWPECSGDPMDCPENEGFGCCKTVAPPARGDVNDPSGQTLAGAGGMGLGSVSPVMGRRDAVSPQPTTSDNEAVGTGTSVLEQFREAVECFRRVSIAGKRDCDRYPYAHDFDRSLEKADRLLAIIDTATSAGTTGDALPELPEPEGEMKWTRSAGVCIRPEPGYDADQMREYARRAREVGNG